MVIDNSNVYSLPNIPCEILYFDEEDSIYIDVIKTDEEHRGKGYARLVMESFIKSLSVTKNVYLLCSSCLGSDENRLVKFYESLGFESYHENNFGIDMILEGINNEDICG